MGMQLGDGEAGENLPTADDMMCGDVFMYGGSLMISIGDNSCLAVVIASGDIVIGHPARVGEEYEFHGDEIVTDVNNWRVERIVGPKC